MGSILRGVQASGEERPVATRDDVARLAGVSSSTVSYVISGRRPISEGTKSRVRRAMKELNYTPNAFARGLAGSRRGVLALHYPYSPQGVSSTEFEYVSSAANRAHELGYHLLLWTQPIEDTEGLRSLVDQRMVDGVLLMEVTPSDPRVETMRASGAPFVLVGTPDDADGVSFVDNDYDDQASGVFSYLASLGHTDAVFFCTEGGDGDRGYGPTVHMRRALERTAGNHGVRLRVYPAPPVPAGGREALSWLLGLDPRPTAVLSFNEIGVAGLLNAAALSGVVIPDDLTVVGLNMGAVAASMTLPPLTTVSPSPSALMDRAVDALNDLIEDGGGEHVRALVAPTLQVRDSSAPVGRRWSGGDWRTRS